MMRKSLVAMALAAALARSAGNCRSHGCATVQTNGLLPIQYDFPVEHTWGNSPHRTSSSSRTSLRRALFVRKIPVFSVISGEKRSLQPRTRGRRNGSR